MPQVPDNLRRPDQPVRSLEDAEQERPENDPLEIDNSLRPHGAPPVANAGGMPGPGPNFSGAGAKGLTIVGNRLHGPLAPCQWAWRYCSCWPFLGCRSCEGNGE